MYKNKRVTNKKNNIKNNKLKQNLYSIKEKTDQHYENNKIQSHNLSQESAGPPPAKSSRIEIQSQIEVHKHPASLAISRKCRDQIEENFLETQESVPASQPPTQRRYLSQRGFSMTISKTQSKSISKVPDSYFEMVLQKTGVNIENSENFILSVDPLTYVNNLTSFIKKHNEFPENIKTFIEGYKEYLNNPFKESKLLVGCLINIPEIGTEYQSQDSMTINFMMINFLQEEIIEILLKKIEKCCVERHCLSTEVSLLPLLLSQLKFVTTIHSVKLYNRILEIYQKASAQGREEIILNAEYILNASKHDQFVQYLIDNSSSVDELLSISNVKAFANLCLSPNVQKNIQKKIILHVRNGCKKSHLAVYMKFLLKFLQDNEENLFELVTDIRTALDWKNETLNETDICKYQQEIFLYIKQGLIRSKKLYDVWQKSLQNFSDDSIKPVDIIIFLMLISIREEKSQLIENLFKKHIKLNHVKPDLVSEAKILYSPVLKTYGEIFLQMLFNFIKEKAHEIRNFAKNCFCIIFNIDECYKKQILNKLVDFACNKFSKDITTIALEVLHNLNERFRAEVQNYGSLLLPMLDQINEIPLEQTRIAMQLICSIAYPMSPLSGNPDLQEHIDMTIKKQICCQNPTIQQKGIIGMVQLINYVVRTELTHNISANYDINESYQTANDLPEGRGKQAASYILRVFSATNHCVTLLGLFYEELAIVFSNRNIRGDADIDKPFLVWFSDLVTYYLQEYFIKEIDDKEIKENECEFEISVQKCRNSFEDTTTETDALNLAINIAEPVFIPSVEAHTSIFILPPLFNLISVLQKIRFNGSLEAINAVLGCGIMLPKIMESKLEDNIFKLKEEELEKNLHICYHTVNWYRTVIGAFLSQEDNLLRKKILFRIRDLIELEETIKCCLNKAPINYCPPLTQFNNFQENSFKLKATIGKQKKINTSQVISKENQKLNENTLNDLETVGNEGMSFLATVQTQDINKSRATKTKFKHVTKSSKFHCSYGPKENYRLLDDDIILLLREEFDITYPQEDIQCGTSIGLKEFKYIMQDLVSKIESINGIKKLGSDIVIRNCHPKYFIEKSQMYLRKVVNNLDMMKTYLLELLIKVNGALGNSALFTDQVNYIKVCFSLCIRFIAGFFSYPGFDDPENKKYLLSSLGAVCDKQLDDINEAVLKAIEYLLTLEPSIVEISAAFYLYDAVNSIQRFSVEVNFEKRTRTMCKVFLCRKWYNFECGMEMGAYSNIFLDKIIKGFLKNSSIKRFKDILTAIFADCKTLKKKDDIVKTFPNIHKGNFPMLFKRLCETLIESTNSSTIEKSSETKSLKTWEDCCNNLNILLDIIQSTDIPRNYVLYLKFSHMFIKIFLQSGLPSFEKSLKKNPDRFNILLKNLQYNTRFLHNLCCHSKVIKNSAVVSMIPPVRETVEKLLYKVQATLAINNCASAFWMGPLKNRDIQGEEINLPESLAVDVISSGNNEKELPIDDDSSADETMEESKLGTVAKKTDKNQSRSDCF